MILWKKFDIIASTNVSKKLLGNDETIEFYDSDFMVFWS